MLVFHAIGAVSTVAGGAGRSLGGYMNGAGTSALFTQPTGVAVDSGGNVYVADIYNHMIRKINAAGAFIYGQ